MIIVLYNKLGKPRKSRPWNVNIWYQSCRQRLSCQIKTDYEATILDKIVDKILVLDLLQSQL